MEDTLHISPNGQLKKTAPETPTDLLRSEEVREIISHRPGFLVRWGVSIFLGILLLLLLGCWFIRYPELVRARARLNSLHAPKSILCRTDAKLIRLLVVEGQQVKEGALLGVLESTAATGEMLLLAASLDSSSRLLENNQAAETAALLNKRYDRLGEVQQVYQQFTTARQQFNDYLVNNFYQRKKQLLEQDMRVLQEMRLAVQQQRKLSEHDMNLARETYRMNRQLLEEKVISKEEFRQQESKLLAKEQLLPQLEASLLANVNQQTEKRKELEQLEHDIAQQRLTFEQALHTLKSAVDEWKRKYLLLASTSGKVTFDSFIQENQQMRNGQLLCFIKPENSTYYAEMHIPQYNFGKVRTGMTVLLKFPSYPFQEYGSVRGKVDFISHIPTDSGYLARVVLPPNLMTNRGQTVQYRDGLQANAEIITEERRLLMRFFYNTAGQLSR